VYYVSRESHSQYYNPLLSLCTAFLAISHSFIHSIFTKDASAEGRKTVGQ